MKNQVSYVSFILFAGFFLSACGSGQLFGPTSTPTPSAEETTLAQVGNEFMEAWKDGRIEERSDFLAPEALEDPLWDFIFGESFTPLEWSFTSINVEGNEGTLIGIVKLPGEESMENNFELKLIKIDENWKVLQYSLNAD